MSEQPRFVVQRHEATALHFDLRLEIDGVLVSWAVPKGPSLDPGQRRLAKRVGDHAMEHLDFEGRAGKRDGTGTVIVWDTGTFAHLTSDDGGDLSAAEALAAGHLRVELRGERLTGAFALTRTAMNGDDANWLLVKMDDGGADRVGPAVVEQLTSVLSGRTNDDVGRDA